MAGACRLVHAAVPCWLATRTNGGCGLMHATALSGSMCVQTHTPISCSNREPLVHTVLFAPFIAQSPTCTMLKSFFSSLLFFCLPPLAETHLQPPSYRFKLWPPEVDVKLLKHLKVNARADFWIKVLGASAARGYPCATDAKAYDQLVQNLRRDPWEPMMIVTVGSLKCVLYCTALHCTVRTALQVDGLQRRALWLLGLLLAMSDRMPASSCSI